MCVRTCVVIQLIQSQGRQRRNSIISVQLESRHGELINVCQKCMQTRDEADLDDYISSIFQRAMNMILSGL